MKTTHWWRWWSEDELMRMMAAKPDLSRRYALFVMVSTSEGFPEWLESKRGIALFFGQTVGCRQLASASRFTEEVMRYIMEHCASKKEWRKICKLPEHQAALEAIQRRFVAADDCCSLTGHGYLCFCNQAAATGP